MRKLSAEGAYILRSSEGAEPLFPQEGTFLPWRGAGVIDAYIHWVKGVSEVVEQLWVHFQVTLEKGREVWSELERDASNAKGLTLAHYSCS